MGTWRLTMAILCALRVTEDGSLSPAHDDVHRDHRKQVTPASLERFVKREMTRVEATLQLVAVPTGSLVDAFCTRLPTSSPSELHQVMDMRGMSKAQQKVTLQELQQRRAAST